MHCHARPTVPVPPVVLSFKGHTDQFSGTSSRYSIATVQYGTVAGSSSDIIIMTHTPVYWCKLTGTGYWYQKTGQCVWPLNHDAGFARTYNECIHVYTANFSDSERSVPSDCDLKYYVHCGAVRQIGLDRKWVSAASFPLQDPQRNSV